MMWQDSFYRGLTPVEMANVGEYNFDHPGKEVFVCLVVWSFVVVLMWRFLQMLLIRSSYWNAWGT